MIKIEYKEKVQVFVDITKNKYQDLLDIAKDLNFKILDSQIIKEKYIDGNIIKN